jgi:DNA repair and recombination protein RAD54B
MAALGQWNHINCLKLGAKESIKDVVLHPLIYSPANSNHSSHTGNKEDRLSSLLEAVDIDNISATVSNKIDSSDVPGGTLSFIFQRDATMLDEIVPAEDVGAITDSEDVGDD